jgi:hypothetical protein
MKVLFLLLIALSAGAQKKWTSVNRNDIIVYSCMTVSGAADGINQAIIHHELGRGNKFWDYARSWKNKYRDIDGGDERAAFFGSKGIFVGFTDAFHLTRLVDRSFTLAAITFSSCELKQYKKKDRWKVLMKKAVLSALANRFAFGLTYNNLQGRSDTVSCPVPSKAFQAPQNLHAGL